MPKAKSQAAPAATALEAHSREALLELYRQMQLIRRFEERSAEQYAYGKIGGFLHLYIGEEAIAVGAIAAMTEKDHLVTHYRDHGYALAVGADPGKIMAELFGRAGGTTGGRGGSMHLTHVERNFWGGYAIVAGHLPMATGIGLALQYQEIDAVSVAIFGDGSTNNGAFHESLNMASVWKVPTVFICENNLYAMGTAAEYITAVPSMATKAEAYAIKNEIVDGQDVLAMYQAMQRAREHCLAGKGPYFIEAMTYRYRGHSMADPESYREKDEIEKFRAQDPIVLYRDLLLEHNVTDEAALETVDQSIEQVLEEAIAFADGSPAPDPSTLYDHIYAGNADGTAIHSNGAHGTTAGNGEDR